MKQFFYFYKGGMNVPKTTLEKSQKTKTETDKEKKEKGEGIEKRKTVRIHGRFFILDMVVVVLVVCCVWVGWSVIVCGKKSEGENK